ncbi:5'-3' exoribonuclease 2 [Nosema bombycis CQ1]|uniref:5'-3' exoribonuclease 2 n=1 Tax=Nosema bombycis (strain CQ1 / CVCC 102059) TaxID=578461 RepID=R0MJH3_NOSB1|nr:5'-3' exoribonuclease 2 [Nosema bombycis CQ1]|eukprot:EOB12913.1 5'-3' exoribonuclease 2 [Nosema bombycis CQ1]
MKYYNLKLHVNNQEGIDNVSIEYVTGLLWVFNYYIKGFTYWNRVYPYHLAPFASDIARVCRSRLKLKPGYPLSPFEQL